ncbi:MAG: iron-sulfur cluster assembly accessory protein [bacterium]|nr:iron-sulfur cluster assembly accessory protein [bacterium]
MKMTQAAIDKVLELMLTQKDPIPLGLRVSVQGGGCSGFQYRMQFIEKENDKLALDKEFLFRDKNNQELKVLVDQASILYLKNCEIDYVETLESAGFKFNNPDTTSTCGCGSSFSA